MYAHRDDEQQYAKSVHGLRKPLARGFEVQRFDPQQRDEKPQRQGHKCDGAQSLRPPMRYAIPRGAQSKRPPKRCTQAHETPPRTRTTQIAHSTVNAIAVRNTAQPLARACLRSNPSPQSQARWRMPLQR